MDKPKLQTLFYDRDRNQSVIEHDDGSIDVTTPGTRVHIGLLGEALVNLDTIQSVGVTNVVDLSDYKLFEVHGITTHHMTFRNGGSASFSSDRQGSVQHFKTSGHIGLGISKDGIVTISAVFDEQT